jgi:glutathione peroxidase
VLGFPCNQFGAQEPGSEDEIGAFCEKNYGVSFPMFAKVDVNGDDAHPLWKHLKARRRACSAPKRSSGTSPSS